jgi:putative transposase
MRKPHRRKSIRLYNHHYARGGTYFLTICAQGRENIFGEIVNGKMVLSEYGKMVLFCWMDIPRHFSCVTLDAFVIMPNHVHGIIKITDRSKGNTFACGRRGLACQAPTRTVDRTFAKPIPGSLATVIGSFKSACTRLIRKTGYDGRVWQRNYHERIIRDTRQYVLARQYIIANPSR